MPLKLYVVVDDCSCGKLLLKRWRVCEQSLARRRKSFSGDTELVLRAENGVGRTWGSPTLLKMWLVTNVEVVYVLRKELAGSRNFSMKFIRWLLRHLLVLVQGVSKEKLSLLDAYYDMYDLVGTCSGQPVTLQTVSARASGLLFVLHGYRPVRLRIERELNWSKRLRHLIVRKMHLEYLMACFSTLGGAHSSLGDFSQHHSVKAGLISVRQYIVATHLDDPVLSARCKLYLAHSLMQRGYFRRAMQLIREQFAFTKTLTGTSHALLTACCQAAWTRLRYLRTTKGLAASPVKACSRRPEESLCCSVLA